MEPFKILDKEIGLNHPTYFIADVAANHDGNLNRAKDLIALAKESGADAVKFQHFKAETIVSDVGFKQLGSQSSHQSKWEKSVFEVYQNASTPLEWTEALYNYSIEVGIHFFTSPYDLSLVDAVNPYVPAFKIGSGDITWHEILHKYRKIEKPIILATGASNIQEVVAAMNILQQDNFKQVALLQCNTNYTGTQENFKYVSLNVLNLFKAMYPGIVLGLSDHTPGHAAVLGAVALGGRIIEKHFTDDNNRKGPDHPFSMNPQTWREMTDRTRELEDALGSSDKKVAVNEQETVVLQRRCIRAKKDLDPASHIQKDDLTVLRPCPTDAIQPYDLHKVAGLKLHHEVKKGDYLKWSDFKSLKE